MSLPTSLQTWSHATLTKVVINVPEAGTIELYSQAAPTEPNPDPAPAVSKVILFRWASTHFADGSSFPIKVTSTYRLQRFGPVVAPDPAPIIEGQDLVVHHEIAVTIYNKGVFIATREVFESGAYSIPANPGPNSVPEVARRIVIDSGGAIPKATEMNHVNLNPSPANQILKAELLPVFKVATLAIFSTHGELSSFRSSGSPPGTEIAAESISCGQTASELGEAVKDGRTVPLFNMAILYSCQMCYPSVARNFGVWAGEVMAPGKALVGFRSPVYPELYSAGKPAPGSLDLHAKKLLGLLAEGATIGEALLEANTKFPPRALAGGKISMVYDGDILARLWSVYEGGNAQAWYLWTPVEPAP